MDQNHYSISGRWYVCVVCGERTVNNTTNQYIGKTVGKNDDRYSIVIYN